MHDYGALCLDAQTQPGWRLPPAETPSALSNAAVHYVRILIGGQNALDREFVESPYMMNDLRHLARIPTGLSYLLQRERNWGQPIFFTISPTPRNDSLPCVESLAL